MAAATDVITLASAKETLSIDPNDATRDDLLEAYITATSERLDAAVGPIVQRTITDEAHDGGDCIIRLLHEPVASITTLTEYDTAGSGTVLTAEDYDTTGTYLLEPWPARNPTGLYTGRVERRTTGRSTTWFTTGRRNVVATYVAGRYATTAAAADSIFEHAARLLLRFLWQQELFGVASIEGYEQPVSTYPMTMPRVVRQMLAADWREGVFAL